MSQQRPPRRDGSGFDADQPRSVTGQLPAQRPTTGQAAPPRTTSGQVPAHRAPAASAPAARTTARPPAAPRTSSGQHAAHGEPTTDPGSAAPGLEGSALKADPATLTGHQKQMLGSRFADASGERRRNAILGAAPAPAPPEADEEDDEGTAAGHDFDGKTAPPELTGRDVWKAVQAPVQSRPGRRSRALYALVLKQFAVGTNPRYQEDAPGKPRGHLFAWDVSRAMNCEIPHFVGARELTLAQTCDWLRHEGPMRGWKRVDPAECVEVANRGHLVVALPRDIRTKQLALVPPQRPADDGVPRLLGAALVRGGEVTARELFGAKPIDCFWHD